MYGICSGFLVVGHYWLISVHQITHWNEETKNQASIRHILEFRVVFTVLSFVGNPVYKLYLPHWYSNIDLKDLVILPGYMCCLKRAGSTRVQTMDSSTNYTYTVHVVHVVPAWIMQLLEWVVINRARSQLSFKCVLLL